MLAFVLWAALLLDSPNASPLGKILPDRVLYETHAAVGDFLNRVDGSPSAAAIQWVKAASHANSPADVQRAGEGVDTALRRETDSRDANRLGRLLCGIFRHGNPAVQTAIRATGLPCAAGSG